MTIKLPGKKNGLGDRLLKLLGKERELLLPDGININPYDIVIATYEGFFRCLLRRQSSDSFSTAKY
jgi:hypothetical protein